MAYLLDTDHLSYLQERNPRVVHSITGLPPQARLLTSVVAVAELLRGALLLPAGRRRREILALYHRILEQMEEVLPITSEVGRLV